MSVNGNIAYIDFSQSVEGDEGITFEQNIRATLNTAQLVVFCNVQKEYGFSDGDVKSAICSVQFVNGVYWVNPLGRMFGTPWFKNVKEYPNVLTASSDGPY